MQWKILYDYQGLARCVAEIAGEVFKQKYKG